MIRFNNVLLDPDKITCIYQDEKDNHVIYVLFDNGEKLAFKGAEGAEIWRAFDKERGWRDDGNAP